MVDTPQTLSNEPGESGYRLEELVFGGALNSFVIKGSGIVITVYVQVPLRQSKASCSG